MKIVDVVHWNPRDFRPRRSSFGRRKDNFGDLLGPHIVELIRRPLGGVQPRPVPSLFALTRDHGRRLLTVGSILHFAGDGDTLWGTGVNGKIGPDAYGFTSLDVRAVRGPRTRAFLADRGIEAPAVFGDPALLLPHLQPEVLRWREEKAHALTVIPNLNEAAEWRWHSDFVDPRGSVDHIVRRIARSERVISSSLHGFIVAEALDIPAALVRSQIEPDLKYRDYIEGTGRDELPSYPDLPSALAARPQPTTLAWDPLPLLTAFPWDLWDDE